MWSDSAVRFVCLGAVFFLHHSASTRSVESAPFCILLRRGAWRITVSLHFFSCLTEIRVLTSSSAWWSSLLQSSATSATSSRKICVFARFRHLLPAFYTSIDRMQIFSLPTAKVGSPDLCGTGRSNSTFLQIRPESLHSTQKFTLSGCALHTNLGLLFPNKNIKDK